MTLVVFTVNTDYLCQKAETTDLYSAPSFCHQFLLEVIVVLQLGGFFKDNVEDKGFDQEMESKEEEDDQEMEGKEKEYLEIESKEEVESQAQDSDEPVLELQPTLDPDSFDE